MDERKNQRIKKTQKAIYNTFLTSLQHQSFNGITVNELCIDAMISRATFYAHFRDKYDLLEFMLTDIRETIMYNVADYPLFEEEINHYITKNKKLITNVFKEANAETLSMLREFMSSVAALFIKRNISDFAGPGRTIIYNFIIGGFINLLMWIIENDYPPDITLMNSYVYELLESMTIWNDEQNH